MGSGSRIVAAALVGLASLAITACSYTVRIRAAFINGRFGFLLADPERPRAAACLNRFLLADETGEIIWALQQPEGSVGECVAWLPLAYGSPPPGVREMVPARRSLHMETLYVLRGSALGDIEGAFILHRNGRRISVENLDSRSERASAAAAIARGRQDEQDRRDYERTHPPPDDNLVGPFEDRPLPPEQH
jgi:hypothetical protein